MLTALQHLRTSHICSLTFAASSRFCNRQNKSNTYKRLYSRAQPRHGSIPLFTGARPQVHQNWVQNNAFATATDHGETETHLAPGLYLVGTPIGNLEDLSVRALKVLQKATVILAEDTRHSRKLLNYYSINSRLHSFHQHNEHTKQAQVLEHLSQGASVALISDAGMPLISDPGSDLVAAAVAAGYTVIPIAGPSAFLLALVASGLSSSKFTFVGFLPDKAKHRKQELQTLAEVSHTLVIYVPPHDLLAVLNDAVSELGPDRNCVVARELTKIHEEHVRCTLKEAVVKYSETAAKGEVTLVIEGASPIATEVSAEDVKQQVAAVMSAGESTSSAAKVVSKQLGIRRKQAYAAALEVQDANK